MTINKEKFLDILEKNIGIILKISRIYAKVEQDREDLMNDIVFELWKSFQQFREESKISTWIYRIALNVSMNYKRKMRNAAIFKPLDEFKKEAILDWSDDRNHLAELDLLYDCIDELNEINKAIILLYLDGNSHEEIAEIVGLSKTNVGTRIGRIKEQIKQSAQLKN